MAAVRRQLTRFFGKRGGRVVEANLAVIEAAYDHLIDVTAAVTGVPTVEPEARHAAQPAGGQER
jgi:Pyruvate/2-oxoacid:ferredoxin oxidoreductase gamma subunit